MLARRRDDLSLTPRVEAHCCDGEPVAAPVVRLGEGRKRHEGAGTRVWVRGTSIGASPAGTKKKGAGHC